MDLGLPVKRADVLSFFHEDLLWTLGNLGTDTSEQLRPCCSYIIWHCNEGC